MPQPLREFGTEEQKQKFLVPLAKGEKCGGFGLTEPSAGSDAGGTKTTADLVRSTERGVLVTRMSAEDDLLYDVAVGRSGVVASGYTTDAGTRQFLLASYGRSGSTVVYLDSRACPPTVWNSRSEPCAPVEPRRR